MFLSIFSVTHDSGNAYMLAFPSFCASVCRLCVCSIEISASRPARDFKFFLFDSSQGLDLPICKIFLVGPPGGKKGGFSIQNFKVWLAICQNITKFDGEHDGAHPRNNWTNFFLRSNKRVTRKYPCNKFYKFLHF